MKTLATISRKSGPQGKTKAANTKNIRPTGRREPHSSKQELDYPETSSAGEAEDSEELGSSESTSDEELGIDGPRIALWEEVDDNQSINGVELRKEKGEGASQQSYDDVISSLSYGSLLKARRVLDEAHVETESDSADDSASDHESVEGDESMPSMSPASSREKLDAKRPGKRANKHAPIVMSSKRAVTRRRQAVEVKKVNYRDPRFSSLADDNAQRAFQKNYSFLADLHKSELDSLKENLKRARNMLRSSPRDQREAWEEEVDRLERAYKRTESAVNRDQKESIDRQALDKARWEEKERRKTGKREWYLKKSARKDLLLKARHDALAESGGRLAVRKAIEKKQKKINQKEKKRRPIFVGGNNGPSKRRKVSSQ